MNTRRSMLAVSSLTLCMATASAVERIPQSAPPPWWSNPEGCPSQSTGKGVDFSPGATTHRLFRERRLGGIAHFYNIVCPAADTDDWPTYCNAFLEIPKSDPDEPCKFERDLLGVGARLAIRGLDTKGLYEGMVITDGGRKDFYPLVLSVSTDEGLPRASRWLTGTSPALPDYVFYVFFRDTGTGEQYYQLEIFNAEDAKCWKNRPKEDLVCKKGNACEYQPGDNGVIKSTTQAGTGGGYEPPG